MKNVFILKERMTDYEYKFYTLMFLQHQVICLWYIFQKVIFKHVLNSFRGNLLISTNRSGFIHTWRCNCQSTTHPISLIMSGHRQQKEIRLVFLDISKSFDKVCHGGLLFKLKKSGIRGSLLSCFIDYRNDRHQWVVLQWCKVQLGNSTSWPSPRLCPRAWDVPVIY